MDGQRFDDLAKRFSEQHTRRGVLGALVGATLGAVGFSNVAEAHSCRSVGNSCTVNGDCCSSACAAQGRNRKICACVTPADCPATDQCHHAVCGGGACSVEVTKNSDCDDGNLCTVNAVCQENGTCVGAPVVCTAPNECFTPGICQAGTGLCSAVVYLGDQHPCTAGVCHDQVCCHPEDKTIICASGACGVKTNNCGQSVQCLHQAGDACVLDGDCCSNVCVTDSNGVNGVCQAGKVATGDACDANSDCASGHCCDRVCRDLTSDPLNCGACGAVCSNDGMQTQTCGASLCNGVCSPGFADCNNDKLLDGCEVDITGDSAHCGACGYACFPGQICLASACVCPAGQKLCGAACILNSDCCVDTDCLTGQLCQTGQCVCPVNQRLCGTECIQSNQCCLDADCSDGNLCTDDVCDSEAHTCSNPAVVCPFDPNHKGNPCWTTVCTDPAVGCESMTVPDGTNMPACDSLGFTSDVEFCYGGNCCLAGAGNYACFADAACCPGYHCVCHNSDPEIGCLNNSGQCELCRHDGIACAQDHECCADSCVSGFCVGG